jgi:hypothetical protein
MQADSGAPALVLERGGRIILVAPVDGPPPAPVAVDETGPYGLHLTHAEPALDYRIRMGALPLEWTFDGGVSGEDPAAGRRLGDTILWSETVHFDGARGPTRLHLESRSRTGRDDWTHRAVLPVTVRPAKLGLAGCQAMVDEMQALSGGLAFDVLGKSLRDDSSSSVPALSTVLAVLPAAWNAVAPMAGRLLRSPPAPARTRRKRCTRAGASAREIRRLAATGGAEPRARRYAAAGRGARADHGRSSEHETAVLTAALLDLLEGWADAVDAAAAFEIDRIERHREYRDVRIGGRRSVWENVDRPLLERMRSAMLVASGVGDEVHAARRRLADAAVEPIAPPVLRARLRGDPRFRAAAAALGPLLASPSRTVRTAEYLKLTGRLYEQWVLLQILAGFRAAGLPEMTPLADREHIGLPGRTDLDRDSTWRFRFPAGRILRIRYEPWIHPIDLASALGDPLYREGDEHRSWSPDILIERLRPAPGGGRAGTVEELIVLDVKYAAVLTDSHWGRAAKYLTIRERPGGRAVVREVWLAHPAAGGRVLPLPDHDAGLRTSGWPRARSRGIIEIRPSAAFDASRPPFSPPAAPALAFATRAIEELGG